MQTKNKYLSLTVRSITHETLDTSTIFFDSEDVITYEPGQFITLALNIDGEVLYRAYSFCTSPYTDNNILGITVRRVEGGKASNYLLDKLKIGDAVKALPPTGHFITKYNKINSRHVAFIGGGSGIVPLFSIIKTLLVKEDDTLVSLIYANSSEEHIIFRYHFDNLKKHYPDRLNLIYALSRPPLDKLNAIIYGRLDDALLKDIIKSINLYPAINEAFVCGPEKIMDMAIGALVINGIPINNIYKESFNTPNVPVIDSYAIDENISNQARKITIIYEDDEYVIDIAPEQTILDAALDNDVDIPFACSRGICNVCRAKRISGDIEMMEDEGLTDEEINDGYILTCVSHVKSDDVTIKVE